MAESTKDLLDKLESKQNELQAKADINYVSLRDKIDALSKELKDSLASTSRDVASIQGTIASSRLILIVGSIVIAILSAVGVADYLRDRQDRSVLKTLINDGKATHLELQLVTQASLVEEMEAEFNKAESLDALKSKIVIRQRIKEISVRIRAISAKLDESKGSTYYYVGDALESYLEGNCDGVLKTLERVTEADRGRFTYAYMRGACHLRTNQLEQADKWFGIASEQTDNRRVSMGLNAQGTAKLYQWRATKNPALIEDAIKNFDSIKMLEPKFSPMYFNLACAYAQKKEYQKATENLVRPQKEGLRSSDEIVQRIREDLTRPSDRFLEDYVRHHLGVSISFADPRWPQEIRKALRF